jgi:hypothetical protein
VRTVRSECLDWILVRTARHLHRVLSIYLMHYNTARPHRGLKLQVPVQAAARMGCADGSIERIDVLGGLIHEYRRAACAVCTARVGTPLQLGWLPLWSSSSCRAPRQPAPRRTRTRSRLCPRRHSNRRSRAAPGSVLDQAPGNVDWHPSGASPVRIRSASKPPRASARRFSDRTTGLEAIGRPWVHRGVEEERSLHGPSPRPRKCWEDLLNDIAE